MLLFHKNKLHFFPSTVSFYSVNLNILNELMADWIKIRIERRVKHNLATKE